MNSILQKLGLTGGATLSEEDRLAARLASHVQDGAGEEEDEEAKAAEGDEDEGDEEDEAKAADGDGDEDKEDDEAKAADGEGDEDKEDDEAKAASAAQKTRIATILDAPEASGREATAKHLAFNTDMAAAEAVELLRTTPKGGKGRLASVMDRVPQPAIGPGGGAASADDESTLAQRLAGYVNRPAARH